MSTTLFFNGTVMTLDSENTTGSCLLIKDNIILGIYNSTDECPLTTNVQMVDLQGKSVIPGFNENHMHLNLLADSLKSFHFHDRDDKEIAVLLRDRFHNT